MTLYCQNLDRLILISGVFLLKSYWLSNPLFIVQLYKSMKLLLLGFSLLVALPALAKTSGSISYPDREIAVEKLVNHSALALINNITRVGYSGRLTIKADSLLTKTDTLLIVKDTLVVRRHFLTTSIYKDGRTLSRSEIVGNYQTTPESISKYRWGTAIIPVGTVIAVAGIAFGYIAVKGEPATEMVRGIRTPADSNPPDVQVNYTKRSVPAILAGLGLFAGGMCLLELSNELIGKSAYVYNAKLKDSKKVSFIYKARLGITPSGNLGVCAWIK